MNVLFVIHRYPPAQGGSERYVAEIARRLVAAGHRATVYASDALDIHAFWRRNGRRLAAGVEYDAGVEVRRFKARVLPLHGAITRLAGLLPLGDVGYILGPPGLLTPDLWRAVRRAGDYDVVYAGAYPALMHLGAQAARRSAAGLVLMPCSHPALDRRAQLRYSLDPRLRRLYSQACGLVALTGLEKQMLVAGGIPEARVTVTGAGVDPRAAQGADGNRFRLKFGLEDSMPLVVFLGHKTEGKGVLHLLEAFQLLLAQRPDPVLVLAGSPTPAYTRRLQTLGPELRRRVLDLRLEERDKHDLLAASSVLVLPSRDDSFGIVLLEAWLHGKPVIGARAGGIPEVIEEGHTGLLAPYGDRQALADCMDWILDHGQQAAEMGARGRAVTVQRWTWDAVYARCLPRIEGCIR